MFTDKVRISSLQDSWDSPTQALSWFMTLNIEIKTLISDSRWPLYLFINMFFNRVFRQSLLISGQMMLSNWTYLFLHYEIKIPPREVTFLFSWIFQQGHFLQTWLHHLMCTCLWHAKRCKIHLVKAKKQVRPLNIISLSLKNRQRHSVVGWKRPRVGSCQLPTRGVIQPTTQCGVVYFYSTTLLLWFLKS